MRKLFILGAAIAIILALVVTSYATLDAPQSRGTYTKTTQRSEARLFVDEDGDGICDNVGTRNNERTNFADKDGDGVCDNIGTRNNRRMNFVDENGDGICDNIGAKNNKRTNFADEDGDGICDNRSENCPLGTAPKDGTGMQHRRRGRNSN